MQFILFISELNGALWFDSVNTFYVVESMSRQGMAASSQWMVMSAPWISMPRDLIRSQPIIISQRSMFMSTTFNDWLISLLACSSGKLKLVAVFLLVARTPAAVEHCHYFLVFLTGSLSALDLARIDSLDPDSTKDFTRRVLDCLSFLPAVMTSLTKIIGLKCMCFSFFLDLVWLTILDGFRRVVNSWASCNALSKLIELSLCSLMLDVLLFNLWLSIHSLQPLFQASSSVSVALWYFCHFPLMKGRKTPSPTTQSQGKVK